MRPGEILHAIFGGVGKEVCPCYACSCRGDTKEENQSHDDFLAARELEGENGGDGEKADSDIGGGVQGSRRNETAAR